MLTADEDVGLVTGSSCSFWIDSLCELKSFRLWREANIRWVFECCVTNLNVCFAAVYHSKFMYNNSHLKVFSHSEFLIHHECALTYTLSQKLVIKTRSVEFMPFYLSLATFLMSLSFSAYGVFKDDPFLYVSNWFDCFLQVTYNVWFFSICIVTLSRTHITLI